MNQHQDALPAGKRLESRPAVADGRKRVVVFRSNLLPYSETFIKEQIAACKDWQPVLVGRNLVDDLVLDDGRVRALYRTPPGYLATKILKALRELGLSPPGLASLMKRERPAIVHVHFGTDAVEFWPAFSSLDVPVIVTLHGYDINTAKQVWRDGGIASQKYPERLLDIARNERVHFIAVSHAIRGKAIAYGIPPDRISVRYIGIDTQRFRPTGDDIGRKGRRVLFVGRFVEKKGAQYLISAFQEVLRRAPDAELVLVGDGPLREELSRQSAALGVPVVFKGRLAPDAVVKEMNLSRVLCLPSITARDGDAEGLGMVLLEAQSCGVPVVSSAFGGATEALIHGQTGYAFREGDSQELARRLTKLILDDSLAASMARSARAFVLERFDIRACTAALERHYDHCAASAVPRRGH